MKPSLRSITVGWICLACIATSFRILAADASWPRVTKANGNTVQVFQPHVENWQSNCLTARAVVQVTLQYDSQPHLGVVWFTAATRVDTAKRLVTLDNLAVSRFKFDSIAQQEANLSQVLAGALPQGSRTIALNRLLVASVVAQQQNRSTTAAFKNDPPIVLWTTNTIAALVLIDGDPVLKPVPDSSLMRVINTASLILFDPAGGTYYLAGNGQWFQSEGISGPWTMSSNPPAAVAALAPKTWGPAAVSSGDGNPVVFVSTKPAELLHTVGAPVYKSEDASGLMYLANCDSQLLYNPLGGTAYLLLSGRWFSASALSGPWTYVDPQSLPPAFAQIDAAGPKAGVLSSVPGTAQADAARAANSVPQIATIRRGSASFQVQYDGLPQFQPIEGTGMQYAVNASDPVILSHDCYYAVGNAVWFVASAPEGPWSLAASIPQEIYTIPPTSPLYYVTFVYIGYADEDQVEVAYTPGYTGSYDPGNGCGPVYGTGYYYTPWVGNYYYGWAWPYGYAYQYRWWDRNWLWRPPWNRVGNFFAVNRANVYDAWRAATDTAGARTARLVADRSLGYGFPTTYGRYAGATRAAEMMVPGAASLVNPYGTVPPARLAAADARGAEQLVNSLRIGSAASRDYYAAADGGVYWRREGKWYRAAADGSWGYVSPAVGPRTAAYHPQTVASYDRPATYFQAMPQLTYPRPQAAMAMDREYFARAAGERFSRPSGAVYRRR